MDELEGEDILTTKDILDMDVDKLDSDDDEATERFSRLAGERKVEPWPVLETANQLKTDFQQEVLAPKVDNYKEQATTRVEDPGTEFHQNVAFMSTLPEVAVPQPAPVQPKAVPMSSQKAEETPKVEVGPLVHICEGKVRRIVG